MNVSRPRAAAAMAVSSVLLASLLTASGAQAAFPGANGVIAYGHYASTLLDAPRAATLILRITTEQIYTVNPDASGAHSIDTGPVRDGLPAWSADGTRIAFVRSTNASSDEVCRSSDQTCRIWSMRSDGSDQKMLSASSSTARDSEPAFSPDGSQIYFTRQVTLTGSVLQRQIWVMGADGSNPHQLITVDSTCAGCEDTSPAASPDGTKLAFVRRDGRSGSAQIFTANVDGSSAQSISKSQFFDLAPNWSPDSSKIVFSRVTSPNSVAEIWLMNADGSGQHTLTGPAHQCDGPNDPQGTADERPAFSPDGTTIAFQRRAGICQFNFSTVVAVMDVNGANVRVLTRPGSTEEADSKPDWQPVPRLASSASVPACSPSGTVAVTVSDSSGFKSPPKAVHYRIDAGTEQVVPTSSAGTANVTVSNGRHTLEYWGENQAGYQQASHNSVSVNVDTVLKCAPAPPATKAVSKKGPSIGVKGVAASSRGCAARNLRVRLNVVDPLGFRSADVYLDGQRVSTSHHSRFALTVAAGRLAKGAHRIVIKAVDQAGNHSQRTIRFTSCGAVPRPTFTG